MESLILRKENITSLELVEQINLFRKQERKDKELRHDNLLQIIRDEFEEEIGLLKIQETPYIHPQNKQEYLMFVLTFSQAKQVLVRESKFVRKAIILYIEELEKRFNESLTPMEMLQKQINFLVEQEKLNKQILLKQQEQEEKLLRLESKITTKDETYYTITGYANLTHRKLPRDITINLGKACSSICRNSNITIGKEYDAKYGLINDYPMEILKEVFNNYYK